MPTFSKIQKVFSNYLSLSPHLSPTAHLITTPQLSPLTPPIAPAHHPPTTHLIIYHHHTLQQKHSIKEYLLHFDSRCVALQSLSIRRDIVETFDLRGCQVFDASEHSRRFGAV